MTPWNCLGSPLSRRTFLHVGLVGGVGLTLDDYFRLRASAATPGRKGPKAESCIHIYLPGGLAHQESFDPKPFAPVEYRGEMRAIDTKLPGVQFNECLPRTAQIADKIAVVRSMTHGEAAHERGTHNMFTGYRPSPAFVFPSMGTIVSPRTRRAQRLAPLTSRCRVSRTSTRATATCRARSGRSVSGADPADKNFRVQDLALPGNVTPERFAARRRLMDTVNDHFRSKEKSDKLDAMDTFYQRAYGLISSGKSAGLAFDINKEPDKLRDEYGRNPAGQRMLMARRLVEGGVRFVTLHYGGWDMHGQIAGGMQGPTPAVRPGRSPR